MLIGQWNTKRQTEQLAPAHKVPYKGLDADIDRLTAALQDQAGQTQYMARGEAYKKKAIMAAAKEDVAMHESCIRHALDDYSQALAQGDSTQLSKVSWFVQRGVLHKELAQTLPTGMMRKHHMTQALQDFTNALHISHNTYDVLTLRGDARSALGLYEAAIDDYTTAVPSATPEGKINALRGRCSAWLALKEPQNAFNDMTQALHVCTTQDSVDQKVLSELLYTRAKVAGEMGKQAQCLQDVGKALELQPGFVEALKTRAVMCYSFGMYAEANSDLCDALKLGAEGSELLSELYRKLKCTQTVFLHIIEGTDLLPPNDPGCHEFYVQYTVRGMGGGLKAVIEGRTLTSTCAVWDEVIQFELPGRGYVVDLIVRDEHPQAATPFLGKVSVDLSVDPSSSAPETVPLRALMNRRCDQRTFNITTGGKGSLKMEWQMNSRAVGEGPTCPSMGNTTGLLTDGVEISEVFKKHDVTNNGYLTRSEACAIYDSFDTLGLPGGDANSILDSMNPVDCDKVTLDEFTVLMLKLVSR